MKRYIDSRGWKYRVMSGIGKNCFKARYQKPADSGTVGWRGLTAVPWRESIEAAQEGLDRLAQKKAGKNGRKGGKFGSWE